MYSLALPRSLVDDFRRDGAVCVRGAFTPEQVALVERGIERNLASPSARAIVASRPGDPGRFFEDFCNWQHVPAYRQVIEDSPLARAAATPSMIASSLLADAVEMALRSQQDCVAADGG